MSEWEERAQWEWDRAETLQAENDALRAALKAAADAMSDALGLLRGRVSIAPRASAERPDMGLRDAIRAARAKLDERP